MTRHTNISITAVAVIAALAAGLLLSPTASAQAAADETLSRESVLHDPENPALGNPKGDITIVAYFDYQCPYCKTVDPELMRVAREDGKVRIVLKDWPIFGAASTYAAKMVLASKYQGKYAEAHSALIAANGKLSEERIHQILATAGVDVARAARDLQTHQKSVDGLLARNNAQAEAFGFRGTPAFIVGTFRVPGVLDAPGFKQAIADARKAARKP